MAEALPDFRPSARFTTSVCPSCRNPKDLSEASRTLSTLSALLSSKVSALRSDRGVKRITTLAESVCVEEKSWASMRYRSTVNGVSGVCARAGAAKSSGKPRLNTRTPRPALGRSAAHSKYLCHMIILPVLAQPGCLERVGGTETSLVRRLERESRLG